MRFNFAQGGVESIYMVNKSIFFRYAYCHSLKLVSRVFLQVEIKSIAQMKFEDLPGYKCVVLHDVLAVLLATPLPNLPPCPTLYASSPQYLASPALLASSPTRTLYPATSSSSSTFPRICLSRPSSQSVAFSSYLSSSSPPFPSAFQPIDFSPASSSTPLPSGLQPLGRPLTHCFTYGFCRVCTRSSVAGVSGVATESELLARP